MNRNKVRGMVIGGAIGDALGMPVETWSPEKIIEVYPEGIKGFIPPSNHKWFDPEKTPAGSTTDDTQLTLATMRGLIAGHAESRLEDHPDDVYEYYMHGIARSHCAAMRATTDGWGHTTRDAIRRLSNGVDWRKAGQTTDANRGTGNGVPMKCSPLAAWRVSPKFHPKIDFTEFCVDYSAMTHYTKMSAYSCICHCNGMEYCLKTQPSTFNPDVFLELVAFMPFEEGDYRIERQKLVAYLNDTPDDLEDQMNKLYACRHKLPDMTQAEIIEMFGSGSCYVYESLPFSYAWFLKDPSSFQILYQVVMAGGDTDTNAKIVGEMLGALHGFEAIQTYMPWAMKELIGADEILAVADKFCDTFGIE